ncbi:SHOCT domain-containing protein [Qipengyuania citrea]|uniref:SHOCT domain-containing protein n=1 Tax=Qipengyuania citrea TaxID=225971 RepID=UPI001E5E22C2|nr:SHOCT domain-containing protein [Qipengyuania citrea]MCD1589821.1 SHOCT domain-containing protein [Qipengyuania citrea]
MRKFFGFTVGIFAAFSAQPALADEPYAVTPNGRAEMMFDVAAIETADLLAGACMSSNWVIKDQSPQQVLCEAPATFGQSLMANLMMGNSYSTPPRLYYRFSIVQMSSETRVQANGWMGLQSAFGQNREMDTNLKGFHNNAMDMMRAAGGRYPEGTSFPNHAYVGSGFSYTETPKKGLMLNSLESDGPFALAGLTEGDVVTRIAGERWKSFDDFYDGLHKAIASDAYEVEFYRGGEKMGTTVARVFRPSVGPLDYELVPFGQADEPTVVVQSEISTADELAKFAELLDKGIITQEEFNTQKGRLLGLD